MKHKWGGNDFVDDTPTKAELKRANAVLAERKKATLEAKAATQTLLAKNKKVEHENHVILTNFTTNLANAEKRLANSKSILDKYSSQIKISETELALKQAELNFNLSIAQRLGTESYYYSVIAFDSYQQGGLSAAEVRNRQKISLDKNTESKNYFYKVNNLQAQLATIKQKIAQKNIDNSVRFAAELIADTGEKITKLYGDTLGNQAKELANNIKGKIIRSKKDALSTFNKIKTNPKLTINAKDKEAISQALKSQNIKSISENLNMMSKSFGLLGKGFTAENLIDKAKVGFQSGNWEPLLVEVEAIALSGVVATYSYSFVTSVLTGIGIVALTTPVALIIVIVLTAFMSSYVDADAARKFNNIILPSVY
ncbi:hypothetical protein NG99_12485 [Erwinia typographi]|uniref:Channel forming colicins domain-containing protein n=1 Tax=Erwinia typographi TaxID=371042 RepID=A0A0A3Z5L5_9GAMM|nr:colicin-like pore-forming protein [Erwinia typographi]KGT93019.1 hypothetical protein NG99_12485 [Erwinia typographi]